MLIKLIIYISFCIAFIIYFSNFMGKGTMIFSLIFFCFYVIPVVIIHSNYYLHDKGNIYEFTKLGITKKKHQITQYIEISNILEIEFFMTGYKLNVTGYKSLPFADYYYARIKLKDNSELILTCLFSSDLENIFNNYFPNIRIVKNNTFYPFIY